MTVGTKQNVLSIWTVLHTRAENILLESFQQMLHAETQDIQTFVRKYDESLAKTFGNVKRLPQFDPDTQYLGGSAFTNWRNQNNSSVTLLRGRTVAPDRTLLCWHSPVTTKLVLTPEKYLTNSRISELPPVLYCFCQTAAYHEGCQPSLISAYTVIAMLIYQLLSCKNSRSVLRDEQSYTKLKREVEQLGGQPAFDQLSMLGSILANLLTDQGLKEVFIVLDRVDRIQGNLEFFLRIMLAVAEKTKCVLKILLTVRTTYAFDDTVLKENLGEDAYIELSFDQD